MEHSVTLQLVCGKFIHRHFSERCGRAGFTQPTRSTRGYTLIEMIATLTIVGILSTIAFPKLQDSIERARVARAIGDIRAIQADVVGAMSGDSVPPTLAVIGRGGMLDPWGNQYVYYPYPPANGGGNIAGARKDRWLHPLNSYFDLYSKGKDGASSLPLTAKASKDDIIRANDGGYIGLAASY